MISIKNEEQLKEFFQKNSPEIPVAPGNELEMILSKTVDSSFRENNVFSDLVMSIKEFFFGMPTFMKPALLAAPLLVIIFSFYYIQKSSQDIYLTETEFTNLVKLDSHDDQRLIGADWL